MRTVPTIGCAGKEHHDYQFQYVYSRQQGGLHGLGPSAPPEAIIGMCRNCGDVYMVDVNRIAQPDQARNDEVEVLRSGFWSQPVATQGAMAGQGGISLTRDRDDGSTNSVPTLRPFNW